MGSMPLYYQNAYLKNFQARVLGTEGSSMFLDQTAFYPRGGGQPGDRGTVEGDHGTAWVTDVSKKNDVIVHELYGDMPSKNSVITAYVDWELRYRLMRLHTALHIMSGVVYRTWNAAVTGANIADDGSKARMDFSLEGIRVGDILEEIGALVADDIGKAAPVQCYELPRDRAMQIPNLIRSRISLLPQNLETIRVVEIEGLDLQADGGTHVSNTREIGQVRILGGSNKGRINRRVEVTLDDPDVVPRSDAPLPVTE